jgi:hypothetical protein
VKTRPLLAPAATAARGAPVDGIGPAAPIAQATPAGPFDPATRCYYWSHVHAQDGVIHTESPTRVTYTLGQFFDLWHQPLAGAQIGPVRGQVTVFVNGRRHPGNPRDVSLGSHEDIQLDVRAAVVAPQRVDWAKTRL